MASTQEPEVQFAQRLASNEKPVRTKAIKKLRKYINVRSQKDAGGFTGDEVLKLWKGLFYCLWMQDKPLLQEELSSQISSLIHSFQGVDGQFLYLESFLLTFKREWTGIDRLRMDKFFQLVRFMFRQTFEMLKRNNWDSGVVARFLELLTTQLLQSGSEAPSGLQFHILDLYMTELAAVGSAELTADQNLTFIEPFCKTAAKTKDRTLFRAICNSIFSSIIDQAPFAIEDLMKEVKAAGDSDSDSGQASEGDDEDKTESRPVGKKGKQMNGKKSNEEEEEDYDDDDDDDEDDDDEEELLHLEDSDTEAPCDDDVGPVLQFDYTALANRLFELASRSTTPSPNRQRLYKIIKVLRDLSEGVFPQDEYPEEVSTDEDDDMFGSRKRMKKGGRRMEEDDDGAPAPKKSKGKKKEATTLNEQNKDSAKDDSEPADLTASNENKKKKRKKKKKKAGQGGGEGGENAEKPEQEQIAAQSAVGETEGPLEGAQTQSSVSSVKVTVAATPEGQPEAVLLSEAKKQPTVTVTEETGLPTPCVADDEDRSEKLPKNKKKREASELKPAEDQQAPVGEEPEMSSSADATVPAKKKKKKKKKGKKGPKVELQADGIVAKSQVSADEEKTPVSNEAPEPDTTTPAKKKKKGLKAEKKPEEAEGEAEINGVSAEDGAPTAGPEEPTDAATPGKRKSKKKKGLEADGAAKVEAAAEAKGQEQADAEITAVGEEPSPDGTVAPLKKKTKKKGKQAEAEKLPVAAATPTKKKKKNPAAGQTDEVVDVTLAQAAGGEDAELPSDETEGNSAKPAKRKKRKIPVVFEFEADEVEAAASVNGLAEDHTAVKKTKLDTDEPSTPRSAKKSQKKAKAPSESGSDFITFQKNATVPTPLFCKTKGSPGTPKSSKKKIQTPKSESKKVTFGLKNNKTAEFRKTDRSLLVSPDGSSRVAFDPKQKPKFGVLKSPATPLSAKVKKTPNGTRKARSSAPQSTPKRRPSAADFF